MTPTQIRKRSLNKLAGPEILALSSMARATGSQLKLKGDTLTQVSQRRRIVRRVLDLGGYADNSNIPSWLSERLMIELDRGFNDPRPS